MTFKLPLPVSSAMDQQDSAGGGATSEVSSLCNRTQGFIGRVTNNPVAGPTFVVVGTTMVCAAIWLGDPTTPGGHFPVCPTKFLFHIYCPGCGSLRMIYSLLHGDFGAAVHYNAVGVLAVGMLIWSFFTYCMRLWTGYRIKSWHQYRYSSIAALAVIIMWFFIRNIPVVPFSVLQDIG